MRYTITVTPPGVGPIIDPEDPENCPTNMIPISDVTSTGNLPTFLPTNAVDDNLSTKWWSTQRVNPSITLQLSGIFPRVCGIDIAWADGNLRSYKFIVSVSNDGTNFANVISGSSNGTTTEPEKYDFPSEVDTRFVRVTITESQPGSPTSSAQISEINTFGTFGATIPLCPPVCFNP